VQGRHFLANALEGLGILREQRPPAQPDHST
jgi:hypothetical protein